ncbi:uncharacterized protein MELLADRAFT_67638 [Melampsora larici-populina 98AG31]|uniref:Uncharacterized protein n=1 Tax=Melampsora larici-populina (strain 98AG31 / pathotype 3-4-7) TaxID=747676 RepID=F4S3W2_MELLP|nr:uncharacterized protein MELLADRAFT_67638 [Melampsora larici-populina 98AG31]EGG00602.1 hypothetical protein MELLADRAFT_67638 [Melampsora larici-populina 98AG31]
MCSLNNYPWTSTAKMLNNHSKQVMKQTKIGDQTVFPVNHRVQKLVFLKPFKQPSKSLPVRKHEASSSVSKGYQKDLISFHNINWFQAQNSVIHEDISPINTDVAKKYSCKTNWPNNIKSGVNIFQEEMLNKDKVTVLTEQVDILKEKFHYVEQLQKDQTKQSHLTDTTNQCCSN